VDDIIIHQWDIGNTTWEPYSECEELAVLDQYLGIDDGD
jgi:hypothetical protein